MSIDREHLVSLGQLSLTDLIGRIVHDSDRQALHEFHERRRPFCHGHGGPMRLVEYVNALREGGLTPVRAEHNAVVLDQSFDLTIDKFNNLPGGPGRESSLKHRGPDCRYYFGVFLRRISRMRAQRTELDAEIRAASILQGVVRYQFYRSCLECRRRANPSVSRYFWREGNRSLCLWMPIHMTGPARRAWLEANAGHFDPSHPDLRQHVQRMIDEQLFAPRITSLDSSQGLAVSSSTAAEDVELGRIEHTMDCRRLAEVVADEKAEHIDRQRPAIQALGPSSLKRMILEVFENLGRGEQTDHQTARRYGLSKATFSRFAGRNWWQGGSPAVADLWVNTAEALAGNPVFVEAAREAGVWRRVSQVLTKAQRAVGSRTND